MHKHQLYINLFTISSVLALSACTEEVVYVVQAPNTPEPLQKTPIELSASSYNGVGEESLTRASIIDGNGKVTAFEKHTRLSLIMVSEDATTPSPANPKYTVTYGLAIGSGKAPTASDAEGTKSNISFDSKRTVDKQEYKDPTGVVLDAEKPISHADGSWRYWDDAHARTSQISVYGFAVNNTILPCGAPWSQTINGKENTANNGWENFSSIDYKIGGSNIPWTIGDQTSSNNYQRQTFLSLLYKDDVCYSNNICETKKLKFNTSDPDADNYRKFDKGELEFHHAMSMLSFKIVPDDSFDVNSSSNFNFKSETNIALKGFNKKGYLNIKDGKWEYVEVGNDATYNGQYGYSWNKIGSVTGNQTINQITDHTYYLLSFVIPGTDIKNSSIADAVTFILDGNEYKLSMSQLYNALVANSSNVPSNIFDQKDGSGDYVCLKAGINYEFTFTVGKTKIEAVTAKLVDWKTVTAEASPENAHDLTVSMEQYAGGSNNPPASYLYKSAVSSSTVDGSEKGYQNSDRFSLQEGTSVQNTGWYWPSNSTYYHFRTIAPQEDLTTIGDSEDNYLTMTGGAVASAKDYVWGAPLKESDSHSGTTAETHPIVYDQTKGYKDYLYPAIGPTKSTIHITQFHMMSDLEFNLLTTTSEDMVDLTNATVTLKSYANTANLMIGTGLVTGHGNIIGEQNLTIVTAGEKYSWRVVPQSLTRTDTNAGKVGLCITTADGNVYDIPDLSALKVTKDDSPNQYIKTWLPGTKYIYKMTLKKTGIDNISATIVDWKEVVAGNDDIKIQ